MKVIRARGGKGWELWNGAKFIGHFSTHRQAWREADKRAGEALNSAEDKAEWLAKQWGQ